MGRDQPTDGSASRASVAVWTGGAVSASAGFLSTRIQRGFMDHHIHTLRQREGDTSQGAVSPKIATDFPATREQGVGALICLPSASVTVFPAFNA